MALAIIGAAGLLAACGTRAARDRDPDTEQQNSEEREALLNAVEEHPSLQNSDLAGPPIDVPTTIPPPAPGSMADHHGMDMNQPMPEDTNVEAPDEANTQAPPTD